MRIVDLSVPTDVPWHHHPTLDGGAPAMTIDRVPLLDAELERIGHVLAPPELVVRATGAGARCGQEDHVHAGCGFDCDATLHLVGRGVRIVGTDGWSWDAP